MIAPDTGGEVLSFGRDLAAAYWTHVPGAVMFQPADALGVRWYYPCTESQPAVTLHFTSVSASGSGSGSGNATAVIRSEVLDQLRYDLGNGSKCSVLTFPPFHESSHQLRWAPLLSCFPPISQAG